MSTYTNPVCEGADPFVLLHDGTYYLYATNAEDGYLVYTSQDMGSWTCRGYCLRACDVKGDWGFWAPEVMCRNGRFYMVYVANEHLGIAVADSPLGPFRQEKKQWLNDLCEIDGHFFVDDDGTVYLYFVRFEEGNVLWVAKMEEDLLSYDKSTATYLFRATEDWELRDFSVVEGAFVLKHKGKYYLTYSANPTEHPDYAIGCAVADTPMGPFVKVDYNPILHRNEVANGPGHHSFTRSRDGRELVCVYHTHGSLKAPFPRVTCVDRAEFVPSPTGGDDRLVIHGPTRTPQKAFGG